MRTPLSPRALLCKGGLDDEGLSACSLRVCLPSAWSLFLLSGGSRGEYTLGTMSCHCRTSRVVSDQPTEDVPPARKACAKRCIQLTRTHSFDQFRTDALSRSRASANRELMPSYEEAFPRSWRHSIFPRHSFRSPSLMVTMTPARPGDRLMRYTHSTPLHDLWRTSQVRLRMHSFVRHRDERRRLQAEHRKTGECGGGATFTLLSLPPIFPARMHPTTPPRPRRHLHAVQKEVGMH